MARSRRPYSKAAKDLNNSIVSDALGMLGGGSEVNEFKVHRASIQGYQFEAHDTTIQGGEICDWLCACEWLPFIVEVKKKRIVKDASRQKLTDDEYYEKTLEPGERSFFENSKIIKRVCSDMYEVYDFFLEIIEFMQSMEDQDWENEVRAEKMNVIYKKSKGENYG